MLCDTLEIKRCPKDGNKSIQFSCAGTSQWIISSQQCCSSSLPVHVLTHISLICSAVGIIDPEQLLHWVVSFFFDSPFRGHACQRFPPSTHPPPLSFKPRTWLQWHNRSPSKTLHKWSSPLHLRRLHCHLFSLFWQPILRSSPLQPPFASLFPVLPPLAPSSPHPFIWSSSWARCNDVFQSQLSASEDIGRRGSGGLGKREGGGGLWCSTEPLPHLDK